MGGAGLTRIAVAVEAGAKRVFASAVAWPGWSRSGRSEAQALEALADYAARYAAAIGTPDLDGPLAFEVVERPPGGSGTDFGVPGTPLAADAEPMDTGELVRQTAILERAWAAFDRAARAAEGHALSTGPRGGGRDLVKMTGHVLEADEAYLVQLGARRPKPPSADPLARAAALRARALEALAARARGEEPAEPSGAKTRWSPRYYVRRAAWHALDHAWELEDRVLD